MSIIAIFSKKALIWNNELIKCKNILRKFDFNSISDVIKGKSY